MPNAFRRVKTIPLNPHSRTRAKVKRFSAALPQPRLPHLALLRCKSGWPGEVNVGALIIRIEFGGILYYDYNSIRNPQKPYSISRVRN